MISFSQLGNMGRLGNQMFQYASLRGIADKNGYEWAIPNKQEFGTRYPLLSNIYDVFTLKSVTDSRNILPNNIILPERYFHFDEELFNNCPDDVDLNGYYQSHKYFEHIAEDIIQDFEFKSKTRTIEAPYVSIHVRRGDYVGKQEFHPVCSLEYYSKAMSCFPGYDFVVFSDDIEWCKQQKIFEKCMFLNNGAAEDMIDMSFAEHNIIANSSFSWWAAFLNKNPNKEIIAPQKWFGPAAPHNTKDIYCEKWIVI